MVWMGAFACQASRRLQGVKRNGQVKTLVPVIIIVALVAAGSQARAQPVPPCHLGNTIAPAYGAIGDAPSVQSWQDIELAADDFCLASLQGAMALVVALAARFDGAKSLDEIAARFGAISATQGMLYWSTTDQRWRPLISETFAIDGPDTRRPRPDFTAQEIFSGRTLYFAQNDTRSTGLNIYSISARVAASDRLVVEIVNLTPVRFTLVTLFEPQALRSVHFIERLKTDEWGYYAISAVQAGAVQGHEKSFINRAAAFYRFLIGVAPDSKPPLAR